MQVTSVIQNMMFKYQMTVRKIHTVGYARMNVIGSRNLFVIASVHSSIH
jgi:hypothetical protein